MGQGTGEELSISHSDCHVLYLSVDSKPLHVIQPVDNIINSSNENH